MSEINNIEIIQNKIDALVDKIIQKENSDENFRITYAQILEKINTKMDVFSDNENLEKVGLIALEIRNMIQDRQSIVDGKFSAIKGEFDNINEILLNSLKTPEFLAAFNKIQNQIHFFSEEQENQKEAFNSIISHIEKFGTLEETNDILVSNFAIVKEQNTIVNENINKQLNLLAELNDYLQQSNKKTLDELNTIVLSIKEFKDFLTEEQQAEKTFLSDKVDEIISKIHETDSYIEILNNNLTTLVQVIGNIFDDDEFKILRSDVADILTKTAFLSETLKNLATKEELIENSSKNKEEIKKHNQELLNELEQKIFEKIDFSDIQDIKEYTEKMFFQGTEVLKDEIWSIKDTITDVQKNALSTETFTEKLTDTQKQLEEGIFQKLDESQDKITQNFSDKLVDTQKQISEIISSNINEIQKELESNVVEKLDTTNKLIAENISSNINEIQKEFEKNITEKISDAQKQVTEDITDTISAESVAASNQISEISSTIEDLRKDLAEIILNEQNEQINTALNNLQTKFVSQLIQIADNINFEEEAEEISDSIYSCSEELKEKITSNISDIKQEILQLKDFSVDADESIINLLEKIENAVQTDLNQDLKTLISGFKLLTSGLKADKDYVYTLPDIESDLTKIRLDLTNLQKVISNSDAESAEAGSDINSKLANIKKSLQKLESNPINEEISEVKSLFSALNEDVSSISKRTNKLILTSDEINKTLKSNIEVFSSLISTFERQSKEFYNSAFVNNLDIKIDNISQTTSSLVQSENVLNEAFMYLGEWIDSASESFEDIKDDVSNIKDTMNAENENVSGRIEALESKLDKIIAQKNDTKELKSLVEYIASQVSVTNEKIIENEKLNQRIANMEKQLKKIETNIAVITEYLDEDDEDNFDDED